MILFDEVVDKIKTNFTVNAFTNNATTVPQYFIMDWIELKVLRYVSCSIIKWRKLLQLGIIELQINDAVKSYQRYDHGIVNCRCCFVVQLRFQSV